MEIDPISSYQNYREFLRAIYDGKKKVNERFSFRRFAEIAGFRSPNYLQMILDGKRNLSADTAHTIAERLKLTTGERDYFVALVKLESASNESERFEAERARLMALKRIVAKDIPAAQREIFGRWFYLLVRELFLIPNAKADPEWICARLGGAISTVDAANALSLLLRMGFLVHTDQGYRPAEPVLVSNDQAMQAALMRVFHADLLRTWAANLETLEPRQQELGVLNIPIHASKIPELRRRICAFQDEIIGLVQDEKDANCVVQLGTYLIPFPTVTP